MKKRTKIVLILVLAIFLTISTTYKKVEVLNKSELNNLSCGWPIQYIFNSFKVSILDPPYPWKASCIGCVGGSFGDSVDICWGCFVFDIAFFYLLIQTLLYSGNIITKKIRRKKHHIRI